MLFEPLLHVEKMLFYLFYDRILAVDLENEILENGKNEICVEALFEAVLYFVESYLLNMGE